MAALVHAECALRRSVAVARVLMDGTRTSVTVSLAGRDLHATGGLPITRFLDRLWSTLRLVRVEDHRPCRMGLISGDRPSSWWRSAPES